MAKQAGTQISGRIGNLIYYRWRDLWCIRNMPGKVHQGKKIKAYRKANGWSTTMGKSLREQVAAALPFPRNFQMQTAVRRSFRLWLQTRTAQDDTPSNDLPYLGELTFNEAAPLYQRLKAPLTVIVQSADELLLHIPALVPTRDIKAPASTAVVEWKIIAACCSIASAKPIGSYTSVITLPYGTAAVPATDVLLPVTMPKGTVTLVVVALQFCKGKEGNLKPLTNARYLPSRVVGGVVK